MRDDFLESVLIGASAALLAFAVHAWTSGSAMLAQALALLAAGVALVVLQLFFSARRNRRQRPPTPDEQAPGALGPPRQNLFFRELNSDWTGLDAPQPARDNVAADHEAAPESELADQPAQRSRPEP